MLALTLLAPLLLGQASDLTKREAIYVVNFSAPAYPRAAKEQRMQGTALTQVTVLRDGSVTDAKVIRSHPIFAAYVLEALKQWRFQSSDREYTVAITFVFELVTDTCEGTDKHPIPSETRVSAQLPSTVYIRTGLPCLEISNSQRRK